MSQKEISIIYSKKSRVPMSFFKYFFEACGVQYRLYELEKFNEKKENELYILYDELEEIKDSKESRFYLIESSDKNYVSRKDISTPEWTNNNFADKVIDWFWGDTSVLHELLSVFNQNELWKSTWLIDEINHSYLTKWEPGISNNYVNAMASLDEYSDDFHVQYMKLYLQYMFYELHPEEVNWYSKKTRGLLSECTSLGKKYDEDRVCFILQARICNLNPGVKKYKVVFLKRLLEYVDDVEIMYAIGREYERVYGDRVKSVDFYKKAYEKDPSYYRAAYVTGVRCEDRDFIKSYNIHLENFKHMQASLLTDCISVREIEIEYKTLNYPHRIIFGRGFRQEVNLFQNPI